MRVVYVFPYHRNESDLTLHKSYEVLSMSPNRTSLSGYGSMIYRITDDVGFSAWVTEPFVMSIKEFRKRKLEKICKRW